MRGSGVSADDLVVLQNQIRNVSDQLHDISLSRESGAELGLTELQQCCTNSQQDIQVTYTKNANSQSCI